MEETFHRRISDPLPIFGEIANFTRGRRWGRWGEGGGGGLRKFQLNPMSSIIDRSDCLPLPDGILARFLRCPRCLQSNRVFSRWLKDNSHLFYFSSILSLFIIVSAVHWIPPPPPPRSLWDEQSQFAVFMLDFMICFSSFQLFFTRAWYGKFPIIYLTSFQSNSTVVKRKNRPLSCDNRKVIELIVTWFIFDVKHQFRLDLKIFNKSMIW